MQIPHDTLAPETLQRLLEEIVTRDGTDYGVIERSTEEKVRAAQRALNDGNAQLFWDEESESASLRTLDQINEESEQWRRAHEIVGSKSPLKK